MATPHARSPSETPHLAAPAQYQQQGTVIAAGSVDCYATGPPDAAACIILIPGVWGWSGGRVRALADAFADSAGYRVLLPKLLQPAQVLYVGTVVSRPAH